MYLDTVSTYHLSFGINSAGSILYNTFLCYDRFIIASSVVTRLFRRLLIARYIVRSHFVTCSKLRTPRILSPAHEYKLVSQCVLLRFSLLLTLRILSLSMHFSPFPCKQLLLDSSLCLFVASMMILLFSAVPTALNEAHRHCADGRRSDSQRVSLKLNVENRYRLVNALTMVSLQILWLQEVDWLIMDQVHHQSEHDEKAQHKAGTS